MSAADWWGQDFEQVDGPDEKRRQVEWAEYRDQLAAEQAERLYENRPARPDPKPAPRATRAAAGRVAASEGRQWRDRVLDRDAGCVVHPNPADCAEGWHAHHVIPQQTLRRERPDLLWHPLAGVGVCGKAHRQHHSGYRAITQDELPQAVVGFLRAQGFGRYLERHYDLEWIAPCVASGSPESDGQP